MYNVRGIKQRYNTQVMLIPMKVKEVEVKIVYGAKRSVYI